MTGRGEQRRGADDRFLSSALAGAPSGQTTKNDGLPHSKIFLLLLIAIGTVSGADRIAFVANLDGNWDLFVVESQGRAQRLTETPLDERAPALSPRGSRVVYSTSD